ncbi:MAG: hypothetical protein ACI94Y_002475, partial [Maribacter sp.]
MKNIFFLFPFLFLFGCNSNSVETDIIVPGEKIDSISIEEEVVLDVDMTIQYTENE